MVDYFFLLTFIGAFVLLLATLDRVLWVIEVWWRGREVSEVERHRRALQTLGRDAFFAREGDAHVMEVRWQDGNDAQSVGTAHPAPYDWEEE